MNPFAAVSRSCFYFSAISLVLFLHFIDTTTNDFEDSKDIVVHTAHFLLNQLIQLMHLVYCSVSQPNRVYCFLMEILKSMTTKTMNVASYTTAPTST